MIRVSPTEPNPTHHISLSDGAQEVGLIVTNVKGDAMPTAITAVATPRTAIKTSTGNTKWSDLEPPWTAIAQESWQKGRGQEDEDDPEMFYDSRRANTMFGHILLSPQETYATGLRASGSEHLPGSVEWVSLLEGSQKYIAVGFTPAANIDATQIWLHIRRRGTPLADLTVALCESLGNRPSTTLKSGTVTTTNVPDTEAEFYKITIASETLVAGTKYWIKVYSADSDDENYWQIGCEDAEGESKQSEDGATWTVFLKDIYYRVLPADTLPAKVRFFQYKQQMLMVRSAESGAPTLWINGDWGSADSNAAALGTLIDATKAWTTNEWVGAIVIITSGVGSNETTNWRKITANDATTLTVDGDWNITHTTATNYVIVNSNKWTLVEGHGLTAPVTDVLVVNENIYFAQGDGVNIRRANWYNNAGTWTARYADDSTNKAEKLCTVYDATAGLQVWKSNTLDASSLKSVAVANAATTWANMTFGTAITLLDDTGKINSLVEYGATKQPWLFREGTVFTITSSKPNEIPLKEMRATMSSENGIASLVHNIYLYFNIGAGLERYYDGDLLDMGMNRDAGLPANRQGIVNKLIGYPGRFFACVDGKTSNYSSMFGYNLLGWHEVYRAPCVGLTIYDGIFQTIYGETPDRLWLAVGADVIWLAFPSLTVDPSKDPNVMFHHEGSVISSWQYDNLFDVEKLWNSIKVFVEDVNDECIRVEIDYQVDDDTTWTPIQGYVDEVPMKELTFSEESVNGKRIRYRLRLMTNDNSKSPKVKTTVIEGVSKVPVKYTYAFAVRTTDERKDLVGNDELYSAAETYTILDNWARSLTKLKMRSVYWRFDDIDVFIDPPQTNPISEYSEGYLDKLTVTTL